MNCITCNQLTEIGLFWHIEKPKLVDGIMCPNCVENLKMPMPEEISLDSFSSESFLLTPSE